MYAGYHEEGDNCPENGCGGQLHFPKAENCSCHINPPCNSCTSVVLTCDTCGWVDDAPDSKLVPVAPSLSMLEHKPRPLDYRSQLHSGCSMKKIDVYPETGDEAADREAVRKEVNGTFGGRFESFGSGKFSFIAYTD